MRELIKSKAIRTILFALGAFILLLVAFSAGVGVGMRKARHFSGWERGYGGMFENRKFDSNRGPRGGQFPFGAPTLPGGHGVFGKVISVSGSTIVVEGKDNLEQNVLVTSSTAIRVGRGEGSLKDIVPDAQAAVFGSPNDQGQIEARLIRLMENR